MRHPYARVVALLVLSALIAACGAGRSFGRGDNAARVGDWDAAVEHFQQAVQEDPDKPEYQIALERAMISASQKHLDEARLFEARGELENALREYTRASQFDPPNRQIAAKVGEIERRMRDQIEAARSQQSTQQLRQTARQSGPPPLFNLNTVVEPLRFNQAQVRDILNSIGMATGINVTYDSAFQDRTYSVQLEGVTLEQALSQIMAANQLFYKVVNQRTIMVIPDNPGKRQQYDELVVQTFFISHADPAEIAQMLNGIVRLPGTQTPPQVVANKTTNTVTVRGTANVVSIIERIIDQNDKPRAEVVIDVQILEVNRSRTKQFGLDLGDYAIRAVFSPEADPRSTGTTTTPGNGAATDTSTTLTPRPFNANTVSRGINTADFYLAVPSAVIRFLESDGETKVIAKPQLRGAEGKELLLNLGQRIPVPSTSFTPIAGGGANINPLTSFNYEPVGVNMKLTPRVTYDGDIILETEIENSALLANIDVAGTSLPSFASRKVTTRLRLREGESTLLAGLLSENERRSLRGFPGILRLPVIRQLFSANDQLIEQTDIVMLLTPRIVRTHELTAQDFAPIFIGTQSNLGLGGPPPLIAPQDTPAPLANVGQPGATVPSAPPVPGAAAAPAPAQNEPIVVPTPPTPAPGAPAAQPAGVPVVPPGSSPIPGTTTLPAAPGAAAPGAASPAAGATIGPTGPSGGQVMLSPSGTEFRVGSGPYTVPVSVNGASQLSSVSLTITFNPAALRVRTVQEGSFMRSGGVAAAFTQQVEGTAGRIDIAVMRSGDATGVAGSGLLAAILFDAVGTGPANLTMTGSASGPSGAPVALQFAPVALVNVR